MSRKVSSKHSPPHSGPIPDDPNLIAAELHRRAQRIVDRVVAEAMEKVRKDLRKHDHRTVAG